MKKVRLTESELNSLIEKIISENSSEFNVEPHVLKTPREFGIEKVFGKYHEDVPADVLRYMRKNPKLIITRLMDLYGPKMLDYIIDEVEKRRNRNED